MKDPYTYENSNILINKFNIKDAFLLEKAEADFVALGANKLINEGFEIEDIFDILKIHKILFSNVYYWAGNIRTINIYKSEAILKGKSIDYVLSSYINEALITLNKEFLIIDWDNLNSKEKIEKICYFISEVWHIHPFREGNTRSVALMLYFLLKKMNLHINTKFLEKNAKYFRNALVLNSLYSKSKPEYIQGIVFDSTTLKNVSTTKYVTIEGFEVNKYNYSNHTIEKIKTLK